MELPLKVFRLLQTQPGVVWNPGLGLKLTMSPDPKIHGLLCPILQCPCGQWSPSREGCGAPFATEDALWPLASPQIGKAVFLCFPPCLNGFPRQSPSLWITDPLRTQYKSRTVSPLKRLHPPHL